MKLDDYEIKEALLARDWRSAVDFLARHFDVVGRLPPLDILRVVEYGSLDVARRMTLYHGRTAWYWDELSGFGTYDVDWVRSNTVVTLEGCDEA